MEIWKRDCSKGWPKILGESLLSPIATGLSPWAEPADNRDVGWMQDAAAGGMGDLLTEQGQYVSPALEGTIQDSSGLWQGQGRTDVS